MALQCIQNNININLCFSDLTSDTINFNLIKGLKIVFLNIRSLYKHKTEIEIFINQYNIDVLCLCETWISSKYSDIELHINGCYLFRCDRVGRKGGGVAIYARQTNKLVFNRLDINCDIDFETLFLEVKQVKAKTFIIACLYRPPGTRPD